jgi:hypothetical protein
MDLMFWKKKDSPPPQTGTISVNKDATGLMILKVTGVIAAKTVSDAQTKILALGSQGGRLRGLIDAEQFQGWARGFNGGMSEAEKMFSIDDITDRIAVVADSQWHEKLRLFLCVWMRNGTIKFFDVSDRAEALSWLQSKSA